MLFRKTNQAVDRSTTDTTCQRVPVPKLVGADIELGNSVLGMEPQRFGTGPMASRLLLREIRGIRQFPTTVWHNSTCQDYQDHQDSSAGPTDSHTYHPQDVGRKFLPRNGGCTYIDLHHLEICLPEVTSAHDWVAAFHAMLLVVREAMQAANEKTALGVRVQVLANNSDGFGNSYGGHLNFLLSRRLWDDIFTRKLHYLMYLASYQVSSVVITGQGKVGSENGAPAVDYQLSQRADFFEDLMGTQTTFKRPLVNSRDEALCGRSGCRFTGELARLHCIFFDTNLCHVANLLKVGVMQVILAILESGRANPGLILDDPLKAVGIFSHDPSLRAKARMASGKYLTAVELQLAFLEDAERLVTRGLCQLMVPRAEEIISLWADTLQRLRDRDFDVLAERLDWILKLQILQRAMAQRPGLDWNSPAVKHLDHLYSSLEPSEGLYWLYETEGAVQRVVSPCDVERFIHEPPEDTRAYARAMLLRRAGPERVSHVDWDTIRFRLKGRRDWPVYRTVALADPLGMTKKQLEPLLRSGRQLEDIVEMLAANSLPTPTVDDRATPAESKSLTDAKVPLALPAPVMTPEETKFNGDSVA